MPRIADYLHALGYSWNWIPYYGSRGYDVWPEWGFDQVWLQPNHYWKAERDMESVCRQIDTLGVGMELEFEPTLLAAREGSAAFRERFRNYLRYAREKGIYGTRSFACYHGTNGFYDLATSTDADDRALYGELRDFILGNPLRDAVKTENNVCIIKNHRRNRPKRCRENRCLPPLLAVLLFSVLPAAGSSRGSSAGRSAERSAERSDAKRYAWGGRRTGRLIPTDAVLCYGQSHHRKPYAWDEAHFEPYVTYVDTTGASTGSSTASSSSNRRISNVPTSVDYTYMIGVLRDTGYSADREQWNYLIDYWFGADSGVNASKRPLLRLRHSAWARPHEAQRW